VLTTTDVALPAGVVSLTVSARSDTGLVRAVNEDSYIAESPLFIVADGMGGHERGDRASQTVAAVLTGAIESGTLPTPEHVLASIDEANLAVRSLADGDRRLLSGTTLVGLVLVRAHDDGSAYWMALNIGDSRIYSWDGRQLQQLSVDHSAVQEMVDAGTLTEEQALVHPDRNIITRAIGASSSAVADVWLIPVVGSQSFLLCSDGLTKELDDAAIACLLAEHHSDDPTIADALVDAALDAGGRDNITVVLVESRMVGVELDTENTVDRALTSAEQLEDTRPRA
jgi:serine/threonine protein phosphatase PrpC